ncbi:ABC transporter ATP-binding protein [Acuticoccus sediminis]|uniref:ABC transporter ATP-binding protein n=1 Tax=Acuticoccus sediminis TaxID=2184697 RepID=UPI001CFF2157|nr:ABC transporter ATP-binding protein [Acuticoccus sediminis]
MSLLEVRTLVAGYGDANILNGVSLDVAAGRIVTLIGPNGAGKSTVLKAITGLINRRGGTVTLDGLEISALATEQIIAAGVGYVPQVANVFPSLTVAEHFAIGGGGDRAEARERVLGYFPLLRPQLCKMASVLSGGERQMLAMARALMLRPKLLLLDEPSAALAPQIVQSVFDRIAAIARDGVAVLLVEQNVKAALPISDYAYALQVGRNALEGTGPELLDDPRLHDVYLGVGGSQKPSPA